jgi:hypothetical protein
MNNEIQLKEKEKNHMINYPRSNNFYLLYLHYLMDFE